VNLFTARRGDNDNKDYIFNLTECYPRCVRSITQSCSVYISIYTYSHEHNNITISSDIQCVPLATEPGISLIILTPMKILQRNLNRSAFVV